MRGADAGDGPAACPGTVRRSGGRGTPALVRRDEGEDHVPAHSRICCILLTLVSLSPGGPDVDAVGRTRSGWPARRLASGARWQRAEEAQEQMLKQLQAISKAARIPRSPDWIPVTFRLTGNARRPAGRGLRGQLGRATRVPTRMERSGASPTTRE